MMLELPKTAAVGCEYEEGIWITGRVAQTCSLWFSGGSPLG